jgi:hypothetical protein
MKTYISRTLRHSAGLTALVLGLGLAFTAGTDPASAAPAPEPYKTEITGANAALDASIADIRARHYGRAKQDLTSARAHVLGANTAAAGLIGAPPTDPESDDLPGPPAVTAVLKLDQRVTTRLVPMYDGLNRPGVVRKLRSAMAGAQTRRDALIAPVLALPPEGDGADYADGLADSLPIYAQEVKALQTALNTYTLSDSARVGLTNALARARATRATMTAAFGGGERSTGG